MIYVDFKGHTNNNAEVNFILIICVMNKWRKIKMICNVTMRISGELFYYNSKTNESTRI